MIKDITKITPIINLGNPIEKVNTIITMGLSITPKERNDANDATGNVQSIIIPFEVGARSGS